MAIPRSRIVTIVAVTTAGLLGLGLPARLAHADHPVAVAAITAGATLGAAVITAGATVVAGVIAAAAIVYTSDGGGEGGGEEGGESEEAGGGDTSTDDGGGEGAEQIGEAQLPIAVQPFIDREISLLASDGLNPALSRVAQKRTIFSSADYLFDGDVKLAGSNIGSFRLKDGLTFWFDISNVTNARDVKLKLVVKRLALTTEDVPETKGYSQIRFTARQAGREIWSWAAQVVQGRKATLSGGGKALKSAQVTLEKNNLVIENLVVPIPYNAPGASATTRVEVDVKIDGRGAKL